MAAASYTTDLTTLGTGDINVDAGVWRESSDAGWDTGGSMVDDQNLYYNNTECVSAQLTKDSNGSGATGPATIMYVHNVTFTIPTDGAVLLHHLWAAPPALNTLTNGGVKILLGNNDIDFVAYNCSGSDFAPAPRGGWANYALNPAVGTADDTVGLGASSPYTMVGGAVGALKQARGNPHACNAVRVGRCEAIFTDGDISNGYATFTGYADVDSTSTNKWNLIDPIAGGFQIQGLMSLGATGTSVDFRDENINLSIINTINVTSGFNKIEVNHASSNIEWTAISISALGTVSIGSFEMVDNATLSKTSCTFTDMGAFTYLSNGTVTNSTYRRCGLVDTGSGTFTGCTFDNATGTTATTMTNLSDIADCTFNSDGTGHAVELTSIGAGTMSWDNSDSDYAGTDGSTGNETIYVNVGSGTLTINVASGATTPTIRTAGATVTVVSGQATLTVTVKDIDTGLAISGARVLVLVSNADNFPFEASITATSSGTTATITHTAHGLATGDDIEVKGANEGSYNGAFSITVTGVNTYTYTMDASASTPATGTLLGTLALINETTNGSGIVTDTRSYSVTQDIDGRVRKSSSSPYYKTSPVTGTVDNANGLSITNQLISDE